MDVELFIYGVPSGASFYGVKEEEGYFGSFYDGCKDKVKFSVQLRMVGDKAYAYYNYLVYDGVSAFDGRQGSYFGISLRLDEYCKDVMGMFRVLDMAYHAFVLGRLLKPAGSRLQYTVTAFDRDSNDLKEKIEQPTFRLIRDTFNSGSFEKLGTIPPAGGNTPRLNLYDCTPEEMSAAVRKYGRVAFSPYYPSRKEAALLQECEEQIKATQKQCDERLRAADDNRRKLQGEMSRKDEEIGRLKKSVSRLEQEAKAAGQAKRLSQIVEPIRQPIAELAAFFESSMPRQQPPIVSPKPMNWLSRKKVLLRTSIIAGVFLALGIALTLFFMPASGNDSATADSLQPESGYDDRDTSPDEGSDPSGDTEGGSYFPTGSSGSGEVGNVTIDIKDYSGTGDLKAGATYQVQAVGGTGGYWDVKGCRISKGTTADAEISIIPDAGSVTLAWCEGGEKKAERTLTAK